MKNQRILENVYLAQLLKSLKAARMFDAIREPQKAEALLHEIEKLCQIIGKPIKFLKLQPIILSCQ